MRTDSARVARSSATRRLSSRTSAPTTATPCPCSWAGGESFRFFLKDYGFSRQSKDAPEARRDRELRVYRDLLAGADLGTPAYYGSVWNEQVGRFGQGRKCPGEQERKREALGGRIVDLVEFDDDVFEPQHCPRVDIE